ncbi:MAG TPA: hypothetical protein VG758_26190 [Hyphomicrobiaceae bacterium]|nr:hypothetical protein [Hyphomicrobiaceae bacterium]
MVDRHTTWVAAVATAGLLVPGWLQDAAAQTGGRGSGATGSGFSTTSPSSAFGRSTGSFTTAPSTAAPATGPMPPSAIGTPAPQVAPVAPLSPPTSSTFLGGGGTTVTTPGGVTTTITTPGGLTTTSPNTVGTTQTFPGSGGGSSSITTGSISPSESAPSRPGGGAYGFQACMGFWDALTHMNKREWAAACRRTEKRLDSLKAELTAAAAMKSELGTPAPKSRHRAARARTR